MTRHLPTIPPIAGFLLLTACMVLTSLARTTGVIDPSLALRILGLCMGLMAIVIGNFLPKLRPLGGRSEAARLTGAERRAGWTLVITGMVLATLFVFAPIGPARGLAPWVALIGLGTIQLDWIWTVWIATPSAAESPSARTSTPRGQRTIAGWLLFGLSYVLVTASLKFILDDSPRVRDWGAWVVVAFNIVFSLLYALMDVWRRGHWSARRPNR